MKINPKKTYFHGSPCTIRAFDYKFTEHGNDAMGSGFYFASEGNETRGFCEPNKKLPSVPGTVMKPAIHEVRLRDIKNALHVSQVHPLTLEQVTTIIEKAPDLLERLNDWGEVEFEGIDSIIRRIAEPIANDDVTPLIFVLNQLSYDFYDGNVEAFYHIIRDMLGYDGVYREIEGLEIVVAWFPEQADIVKYHKPDARFDAEMDDPHP